MKLVIVGVGLMGGSFALGIKERLFDIEIVGVDTNPDHLLIAMDRDIIDYYQPWEKAIKDADIVILATPVDVLLKQIPDALDAIGPDVMVVDFGSTKAPLCAVADQHPKRSQYIAAHPICGVEYSGPEAAFTSLFERKIMILCDEHKSSEKGLLKFKGLCKVLAMNITSMEPKAHDVHLAYVSHLSHITSFALGVTVLEKEKDEESIFSMAGSGFSSTVRLAKSSPDMWTPIFAQNRENISKSLGEYIEKLQVFKNLLDKKEDKKLYSFMAYANEIKNVLEGI